jgi:serine/threonine-protein kinase
MTGQVLGTAAYISPEQALGHAATAASDRYALAVVAYELLAGRRPFQAEHLAAQARAHVENIAPAASEAARDLPAAVDDVLWQGLEKDPARRWPTASSMVEALGDALGDAAEPDGTASTRAMPIAAAAPAPPRTPRPRSRASHTPPPRTPPPPRRPTAAAASGPPGGRRGSRSWVPFAALAAIALLIGAGIAAFTGGGGSSPGDTPADRTARRQSAQRDKPRTATQQAAPAQQAQTQTSTAETQPPATPAGDPGALQAQGHQALAAGNTEQAISLLRQAVQNCPISQTDPCAYAYYDLGVALLQAGRPQEAAQALQIRMQNPDQQGTVKKALKDAMRGGGWGNPNGNGNGGRGGRQSD